MFTGIVETLAELVDIKKEQENIHFTFRTSLTNELKIDQSVAHNGVCLTVVAIEGDNYVVTAVDETLQKSNLRYLKVGDKVNFERCMLMNGRLDGHIVQGHVDATGKCLTKEENKGSWRFVFSYKPTPNNIIVEKGSITINGVSLTAFNVTNDKFEVTIIPYTYLHTNFHSINEGDNVNLEFDIIGKYIAKLQGFI